METSCPTINSIKSYLKVDLPKAREIHGILSGIVTVRRYKLVQETIDEAHWSSKVPQYLQLLAVAEVLGLSYEQCVFVVGDTADVVYDKPSRVSLLLPNNKYEYAILWYSSDNKFIFKKRVI